MLAYLAGRRTDASLIEFAETAKSDATRRFQRCQANFLVGTLRLLAGEKAGAAGHFRIAVAAYEGNFLVRPECVAYSRMEFAAM